MMIHLASQAQDAYRQNRIIYSASFVFGCAYLTLLFFWERFRDFNKYLPGGLATAFSLPLLVIGISAYLLH